MPAIARHVTSMWSVCHTHVLC